MCRTVVIVLLIFGVSLPSHQAAARGIGLIQDTEIENALRAFAVPIFKAAGLKASSVEIYIVNDDSLNAFVAGGQKLFMNSGLLLQSDQANQIIGVIAHETGHIAGGHLSRIHSALSKSSAPAILATILGGAASIVTGRGDVGAAIAAGGQNVAERNFLAYSRTQESAADHAALGYLDKTGQSARGLLAFMRKLEDQELLSPARQDPYIRSHPLSGDRVATVENHVANSPHSENGEPPGYAALHARMKAKLLSFLRPYGHTLRTYPPSDNSIAARYARAVAEYRNNNLKRALEIMNGLIREHPGDPYFHELKGQMLFENGRAEESMAAYATAAELLPDAPYIHRDLARAQMETGDPRLLDSAIANMEIALAHGRKTARNWRFLAIAHGRKGDLPRSYLALGEEALILGKPDTARYQAERAKKDFPRGSREWLQAEDIVAAAEEVARILKRRREDK